MAVRPLPLANSEGPGGACPWVFDPPVESPCAEGVGDRVGAMHNPWHADPTGLIRHYTARLAPETLSGRQLQFR